MFLAVRLLGPSGPLGLSSSRHVSSVMAADVILALETVEAILLMLAGSCAIAVVGEIRTAGSPSPESRALIGD